MVTDFRIIGHDRNIKTYYLSLHMSRFPANFSAERDNLGGYSGQKTEEMKITHWRRWNKPLVQEYCSVLKQGTLTA